MPHADRRLSADLVVARPRRSASSLAVRRRSSGRANTIRPALVGTIDDTTNGIGPASTRSTPPLTTTIEPSSRNPTPWPAWRPARCSATRIVSPASTPGHEIGGHPPRDDGDDALHLGDPRQVDVVGEQPHLEATRERDELGVDLAHLRAPRRRRCTRGWGPRVATRRASRGHAARAGRVRRRRRPCPAVRRARTAARAGRRGTDRSGTAAAAACPSPRTSRRGTRRRRRTHVPRTSGRVESPIIGEELLGRDATRSGSRGTCRARARSRPPADRSPDR